METHLSDLTVSLRRRRRGNERKARISEIPGAGKGLTRPWENPPKMKRFSLQDVRKRYSSPQFDTTNTRYAPTRNVYGLALPAEPASLGYTT